MVPPTSSVTVLEPADDLSEPSLDQIIEYAEFIGIDPDLEPHLMWIAREGVMSPVPPPWKMCTENGADIFYFNFQTGESVWDHPCDEKYSELLELYRKKEGKDMTGLLSPETLCALREAEAAGLRLCTLPPIDEVSCEFEESAPQSAEGSTCEDSSDAEDLDIEDRCQHASPKHPAASSWDQASESEDYQDEDSMDSRIAEQVLATSAKGIEDSEDSESGYTESIDEDISCPQGEGTDKEMTTVVEEVDKDAKIQLSGIQADLLTILDVLGELHQLCGSQRDNLQALCSNL
jgi:centrosomal protein CEP164